MKGRKMSLKNQEIGIKISGTIDPSLNKSISAASNEMQKITKGAGSVSSGFKGAGQSGTQFGMNSVTAVNNLDNALATAGIVTTLTATYNAFMDCVGASNKYESAIAKISTIADTTEISISNIKDSITDLSNDTGKRVGELSEAEYQAISASVDTARSVEFVGKANQLAVGGFTDAAKSVDVLTTVLNAYDLEVEKASEISDMLILTQNKGKTTVDELAESLGSVIPTASAYNTNMANISTAYALMTKNGIATANTGTEVRGMLNELGNTGSTVSKTLYAETGKTFASLMASGKSLGDVVNILSQSVDNDATAFRGLWSNVRASQAALSLFNVGANEFNSVLSDMENSTGTTAKAYGIMTSTAEHAQEVFATSAENLQISIGEILSPTVEELFSLGTDGLQIINQYVEANPELVKIVAAATVGIGVFAGGLVAYTAVTKIATVTTNLFTAAMYANPVFMGLTIAAAVITSITLFAAAMANATLDADELTGASKKQEEELSKLNAEYDEAVKKHGKTSDEAIKLKNDIDNLTEEFEKNKQTLGELIQKQADLSDAYEKIQSEDQTGTLEEEAASANYLANKLFSLAEQTNNTAREKQEMLAIIKKLNEEFPNLSLNYDDVINKTAKTKEALQDYLKSLYNQEQYENAQKQWTATYDILEKQREQYKDFAEQISAASEEFRASADNGIAIAYNEYQKALNGMVEYTDASGKQMKISLSEAFEQAGKNISNMKSDLEKYENTMLGISGTTDATAKSSLDWKSVTSTALQGVQTEIDSLAAAYDTAYEAAYKSITSTVSITKKLSYETDVTAQSMSDNWKKQAEWIDTYSANIKKAESYGLTDSLITALSDGSEQSGQYINSIISQLDKMNQADVKSFVNRLNSNFEGVAKAEDKFADTVAGYSTDFDKTMDDIVGRVERSIKEMGLEGEARKTALSTIDAYVEAIRSGVDDASSAAQAVANAVKSNLTTNDINPYQSAPIEIEGNAKGTKHSADIFIAGEKGPELIVNAGGSQVFTAAETQRILSGQADNTNLADYNTVVSMFDVPELVSQLYSGTQSGNQLSLNDMAKNISDSITDNSSHTFIHSPTYNINVKSGSSITDEIKKADRLSKTEFEKYMKEYENSRKRISFKSR